MENINRISILGGSGNGKTTLSNNLGEKLNLPVYHIDGLNYLDNWVERDKKERDRLILEILDESKWVIDGTYRDTLSKRLEYADLVIFLDYSTFAQLKGVLKRGIKNYGKEKKEIPGCKERINFKFIIFVLKWRKTKRKDIIEKLEKIDKNKILIFKNRRKLNKWYINNFNEKIKI